MRALGPSAPPGPPCAGPPESNARAGGAVRPDTHAGRSRALGGQCKRNPVPRCGGGQSRPDRARTTLVLDCATVSAALDPLAGGPGVPMGCRTSFTAFILEHNPGVRCTGRNVQLIYVWRRSRARWPRSSGSGRDHQADFLGVLPEVWFRDGHIAGAEDRSAFTRCTSVAPIVPYVPRCPSPPPPGER